MSTRVATSQRHWPKLLTPGPITTSVGVKASMQFDSGSRDSAFIELTASLRHRLADLVDPTGGFTCVPMQGSGTFSVEAMVTSLLGPDDHLLVCANGTYGSRIETIAQVAGIAHTTLASPELGPTPLDELDRALQGDGTVSHVAIVHCETTSGVLNPLDDVCEVASRHEARVLVDAMGTFGGIPFTPAANVDAVAASANKCLQGVPGLGFVLARPEALTRAANFPVRSLSLDLVGQWRGLEANGQFRFTPPTHVMWALGTALDELEAEGGPAGRYQRYRTNHLVLTDGMTRLGYRMLVDPGHQAPIIATFLSPTHADWDFRTFYDALVARGFAIYPGKLTEAETFRIGCIGDVDGDDMASVVTHIEEITVASTTAEPANH